MLNTLIQRLNELLFQKNDVAVQYKPGSEVMEKISRQILELKSAVLNNISMQLEKNLKAISYLDQEITELKRSYSGLPVAERDYINLKSAFDVNQKVFNYLSEKKLEARISRAAATPSGFVIDKARPSFEIISPFPGKVYTIATLSGLCISLVLIFGLRLLHPYIHDRETLEELTDTCIIGTVSSCPNETMNMQFPIASLTNSKTGFAESIRSLRTHLAFLSTEKQSKIICITSEISGEGKSLISVNLAGTLSLLEKKVIIVATDLRKSKIHPLFQTGSNNGLSDYLAGTVNIEEVIFPTAFKNLFFLASGSIPPNPGELLFSERMKLLLHALEKEYDFIILDTAPIGLVSDAIPLTKLSDINLFVIRAGFSRYQSAILPTRLKETYGLPNFYLLLNDVKSDFLYDNYHSEGYNKRT
jgi:capsular exopolysaccharide synthesis family protein